MKPLIKNRSLLFLLFVMCVQLALYMFLSNRAEWLTPPGHVHTIALDTFYPDIMRQSILGRWAVIDDHTTLPAPAVPAYFFFILAGKVAALLNIDPVNMYELLRITGAVLVFAATYMLIIELLPPALHILAIVFTLVIDTGPLWSNMLATTIAQWAAASPLQFIITRHFGLPHHLWAEAMGLMLIYITLRAVTTPSLFKFMAIILLGFIGTVSLPSYFVILTACVFAPWLLYALMTKTVKRTFPPVILAVCMVLAAGLWIKYEFDKGPPWNTFTAVEKSWWTTDFVLIPFIQSFTFFYPFVAALLVLVPASWSRWSKQIRLSIILTAGWSFLPVALIYLSQAPWFPVANGRIACDVSPVPIGILSTIGVYALWQKIRHIPRAKTAARLLIVLFITISLFFSVLYFRQYMITQDKVVSGEDYSWTLYPTRDLWNGVMALKKVPAFSHVMVNPHVGDLIIGYLPLRVYQTALSHPPDWYARRGLSYQFYTGKMELNDLRELFRTNAISYVFYGPEEKHSTLTTTFYPDILEVIYQNPEVTIYKVKNL